MTVSTENGAVPSTSDWVVARPHAPVDVVGDQAEIRLRVPAQADRDVPLGAPAESPGVEVDGAVAGGQLEHADPAPGDALRVRHRHALEGRVGGAALGRQRVAAALPVQHQARLDVAALEAEDRRRPAGPREPLDLGMDVLGLEQPRALAIGEFGADPGSARHVGQVAGIGEGTGEQGGFRLGGEAEIAVAPGPAPNDPGEPEMQGLVGPPGSAPRSPGRRPPPRRPRCRCWPRCRTPRPPRSRPVRDARSRSRTGGPVRRRWPASAR